jgi:hypothetical protein
VKYFRLIVPGIGSVIVRANSMGEALSQARAQFAGELGETAASGIQPSTDPPSDTDYWSESTTRLNFTKEVVPAGGAGNEPINTTGDGKPVVVGGEDKTTYVSPQKGEYAPEWTGTAYDPYALQGSYRRGVQGRGANLNNLVGQGLLGQQDADLNLYKNALDLDMFKPNSPDYGFQEFTQAGIPGGRTAYAQSLLKAAQTPDAQGNTSVGQRNFTMPQTQGGVNSAIELALQALGPRSGMFRNAAYGLGDEYGALSSDQQVTSGGGFLDWLKTKGLVR